MLRAELSHIMVGMIILPLLRALSLRVGEPKDKSRMCLIFDCVGRYVLVPSKRRVREKGTAPAAFPYPAVERISKA